MIQERYEESFTIRALGLQGVVALSVAATARPFKAWAYGALDRWGMILDGGVI